MPLTDDELDALQTAAYLCDGEPFDYFERNVLRKLAAHSEGELWALAGMFLDRMMPETARFIAAYASAVRHADIDNQPRPEPCRFLADWDAEQQALLAMPIPDTIEEALAEVIATAQPNMEAIEELRAAIVRETEELQRDNTKH